MHDLITIGDPVIDTHVQIADNQASVQTNDREESFLCFPYGQKISINDSFQALGGNAADVAVGASRLGLKTALLTTLGGDAGAQLVSTKLQAEGIATDYIMTDPKSLTRYSIILNYKSERTILTHADKRNYAWPDNVGGANWLYYSGLGAGFEKVQKKILQYLKNHSSTRLAVNPGSYMLEHGRAALKDVLLQTDLLFVNLEEAEILSGTTLAKQKSVEALLRALLALGPDEVVITDGEKGAWASTSDEWWHIAALPVKVVSKTGAGDAFASGYLAARFYEHDIKNALQWGIANSSAVIGQHGAQTGLQNKTGLLGLVKKYSSVTPVKQG
ncbi:MAG: hypothetical protein A3I29_03275 [Candidatus Magasanikbacteria bacterium RIFCSPLOWO2_02_FULL_44_11]|uniref:Carbohydrate kinase PfkB domain-containing protein n=2 Tax=Candidatus Magasanikiibacteriota TaxID=1752731 RepID=A0A1F6NC23_9BACT|nr:MAG: hypothetical protein A3D53_02035 [Candidatus Magasanikbacteria bacterium RIFCSPHIGHO2_02_FULL_45_10]OGH81411.1 MAG: hypothetical protein A3I29_03275 [Candidatus Magasanikbacteria bacterium RIFCSPLOWO2_02_FULL_44_11]